MNGKPPHDIYERTKVFALRVIRLFAALPKTTEARVIGKQVLRSATSVGAHLREGRRSRSDAELVSKIGGALQELDENGYWLELLSDSEIMKSESVKPLLAEVNELTAILVTSVKNVKARKK
jgi:four helix bundle protein